MQETKFPRLCSKDKGLTLDLKRQDCNVCRKLPTGNLFHEEAVLMELTNGIRRECG